MIRQFFSLSLMVVLAGLGSAQLPDESEQDGDADRESTEPSEQESPEEAAQDGDDPAEAADEFADPAPAPIESSDAFNTLRFDHAYSLDEIEAALSDLAARAPELATLRTIGKSRAGRALHVLSLTAPTSDTSELAPARKPALLVCGYRGQLEAFGAEAALAFAQLVIERAQSAPFASLLDHHVILIAPALDPDARSAGAAQRPAARFDLNFPLGWRPETLRPGAGNYPLATPESLAVAEFLQAESNLTLIVAVDSARPSAVATPYPGAEFPEADRAVLTALAQHAPGTGTARLRHWGELGSEGGGFLDYAFQALGVFAVAWSGPAEGSDGPALEAWAEEIARRTAELSFSLPRVRVDADSLTPLAPDLWQLDLALRNAGSIPTQSELGAQRFAPGALELSLSGADLVATALRQEPSEPYRVAELYGDDVDVSLGCGILGGGETRWLRLVIEAPAGTAVQIRAAAARAGLARLDVVLQ